MTTDPIIQSGGVVGLHGLLPPCVDQVSCSSSFLTRSERANKPVLERATRWTQSLVVETWKFKLQMLPTSETEFEVCCCCCTYSVAVCSQERAKSVFVPTICGHKPTSKGKHNA